MLKYLQTIVRVDGLLGLMGPTILLLFFQIEFRSTSTSENKRKKYLFVAKFRLRIRAKMEFICIVHLFIVRKTHFFLFKIIQQKKLFSSVRWKSRSSVNIFKSPGCYLNKNTGRKLPWPISTFCGWCGKIGMASDFTQFLFLQNDHDLSWIAVNSGHHKCLSPNTTNKFSQIFLSS